jgi:hypothetical protein
MLAGFEGAGVDARRPAIRYRGSGAIDPGFAFGV